MSASIGRFPLWLSYYCPTIYILFGHYLQTIEIIQPVGAGLKGFLHVIILQTAGVKICQPLPAKREVNRRFGSDVFGSIVVAMRKI